MKQPLARFSALQSRDFRLWWIGYVISIAGQQMLWMTEGWLIYELSDSKLLLGVHGLAQAIPATLLAFVGGAVADKVDQKRLLIIVQFSQAFFLALLAWFSFAGTVTAWHVIAIGFVISGISSFEQPARHAMFPYLVNRASIANAVGLNAMVHPGTRVISPIAAGFLLAWVFNASGSAMVAGGVVFSLTTAGILAYTLFLSAIRLPFIERAHGRNVFQDMGDGLRFVARNRIYGLLVGLMYYNTFFGLAMSVLFPVMAKDVLGLGPEGLGILATAHGLGSLTGATTAALFATRGQGRFLVVGSILLGTFTLVFGLSSWYFVSLAALWAAGLGGSLFSVGIQSSIQLMVPNEFRGRIMGIWSMTHSTIRPLGEMQFGAVAAILTAPFALAISGGAIAAMALLFLLPNARLRGLKVGGETMEREHPGIGERS